MNLMRNLFICTLVSLTLIGLEAIEKSNKETAKDLTPGVLVCNGKEDKCSKDEDQEESPSSILFSVFGESQEDEMNLLICKKCL